MEDILLLEFHIYSFIFIIKQAHEAQNKKVRIYTTVIAFTEDNREFRENLIGFFEEKIIKAVDSDPINIIKPGEISK